MQEYTKMRIPGKRYLTNTARSFRGTWSASALRYLGGTSHENLRKRREAMRYLAQKSTEKKRSYKVRNFSVPD